LQVSEKDQGLVGLKAPALFGGGTNVEVLMTGAAHHPLAHVLGTKVKGSAAMRAGGRHTHAKVALAATAHDPAAVRLGPGPQAPQAMRASDLDLNLEFLVAVPTMYNFAKVLVPHAQVMATMGTRYGTILHGVGHGRLQDPGHGVMVIKGNGVAGPWRAIFCKPFNPPAGRAAPV
jgi:hypothetical protein